MIKWIRRLLYVFVLLLILLVVGRNIIGVWIAEETIQRLTGFTTRIGFLNIKLTHPQIIASDITIRNPRDLFKEPRAFEINRIEAEYELASFLKNETHFRKLVLEIVQVVAVRNASKEINLRRLQGKIRRTNSKTQPNFQIDELILSISEVLYIDEGRNESQPKVYRVNAENRIYRNIKDPQDLKNIVVKLTIESLPTNLLELTIQKLNEEMVNTIPSADKSPGKILDFLGGKRESK